MCVCVCVFFSLYKGSIDILFCKRNYTIALKKTNGFIWFQMLPEKILFLPDS